MWTSRGKGGIGEEEEDRGKGIWEGYVGRKGEEKEDCGKGIGEGYLGRKGEEEEDYGKGMGRWGGERKATVVRLLSLGISHGRLPSNIAYFICGAAIFCSRLFVPKASERRILIGVIGFAMEFTAWRGVF